jgi:hypothetical protein
MFNYIFKSKKNQSEDPIVKAIVSQTTVLVNELQNQMNLRFKELSAQIKEVELGLAQMENKLLTKDLKDKQAYGLLHYKLHEAKNTKLQDEINELEKTLNLTKPKTTDH